MIEEHPSLHGLLRGTSVGHGGYRQREGVIERIVVKRERSHCFARVRERESPG